MASLRSFWSWNHYLSSQEAADLSSIGFSYFSLLGGGGGEGGGMRSEILKSESIEYRE